MHIIRFLSLLGILLFSLLIKPVFGFDHSHRQFNLILKKVVVINGPKSSVRYASIKSDSKLLDQYLREIEIVTLSQYKKWSKPQKMAFLINAYNALTIKLILTKYPDLSSIKDLGGVFSSPWKIKFFTLFGEKNHLDYIEHSILRKQFNEPRIHFAIVCAFVGCPALQNEAYIADRLDWQLNEAMKNFLKDPDRNYYHNKTDKLRISLIFKWFENDFAKDKGSVETFIAPWITDDLKLKKRIQTKKVRLEYLDYDWSLNSAD